MEPLNQNTSEMRTPRYTVHHNYLYLLDPPQDALNSKAHSVKINKNTQFVNPAPFVISDTDKECKCETILVKYLRHEIRWRSRPPASCLLQTLKSTLITLRMYVAITCALVCVYSHMCVHYCRILCILCVYAVCVNVLSMVEVNTNHPHLHNKLSLAYVIFVHSVNHQSQPITLPHTPRPPNQEFLVGLHQNKVFMLQTLV